MMRISTLHLTNTLNWILLVKQQPVGRHVAPLGVGHIILVPSQPNLLLLLKATYLAKKKEIPII
jgi:hypothetical protein